MTEQILDTYGSVTIGATGTGSVTLTPRNMLAWHVTRMAVRTSQGPTVSPIPQCTVYLNSVADGNIIDQTWTGSRDVSDCDISVINSQSLIFVWENGIPGTTATASIYGTQTVAR